MILLFEKVFGDVTWIPKATETDRNPVLELDFPSQVTGIPKYNFFPL